MVPQIIWSEAALLALENEILYLEENFTGKEIQNFTDRITQKLLLIQTHPKMGRKVSKRQNVFQTGINKRIEIYYLYRPIKKEIHILALWNTLQNPQKLRF
jgi:plasmid stabilization system protein ParE